ncbi:MAG: DUF4214 domain-containing protein [Sulfitobacter sp.]|nr:DUF4214 domain-containing protein [Sulfitobacter sp.]
MRAPTWPRIRRCGGTKRATRTQSSVCAGRLLMTDLVLTGFQQTEKTVSSGIFGANAVYSQLEGGTPADAYTSAADALGMQDFRFGGGQADANPFLMDSRGDYPADGVNMINTVAMPNGDLQPDLRNFLDWIESGDGTRTATLIIPTKHLSTSDYYGFAWEISSFVTRVMNEYGPVISAFEIGNEHWEMGETAYGTKASIATEAIVRGLAAAGVAEADQPSILVQMASAGYAGSEFPGTPDGPGFRERAEAANSQIIAQLSDVARDAIDGVVEHYYYNKPDRIFSEMSLEKNYINVDLGVWQEELNRELEVHITEWNIRTTAFSQQGMVAGSTLLKQFENMVDLGVDTAHIWALDFHSRTALTLDTDEGARLDAQGRLTNSAHGAVFDLLSENAVGKDLVDVSFANQPDDVEVTAFADTSETVMYISSRSLETESFHLDLSAFLTDDYWISGVKISMDEATSNGRQWERGVAADAIMLQGAPYYYNEHDVDIVYTDLSFSDAADIHFDLKPFEVIEITLQQTVDELTLAEAVSADASNYVLTTRALDALTGSNNLDVLAIADIVSDLEQALSQQGSFLPPTSVPGLYAGSQIPGQASAVRSGGSLYYGNAENDILLDLESGIATWAGHSGHLTQIEWMTGGTDRDTLLGGDHSAVLSGLSGNDRLFGDGGADWLIGGSGNDFLNGGVGTDTAAFAGDQRSFTLTFSAVNDNLMIEDRRPGGEGTDTLRRVEFLDFEREIDLFGGNPMPLDMFLDARAVPADEFIEIIELYIAYFNRAPDAIGLNYWANLYANGISLEKMAANFFTQPETQMVYQSVLDTDGTLDIGNRAKVEDFVSQVYGNVLGRQPDSAGFNFWVEELQHDPTISPDIFILAIIGGAKFPANPTPQTLADQDYLATKADIGAYFAITRGMSDTGDAAQSMALFNGTDWSLDAAIASIDAHYDQALDPYSGDFLMPLVGVIDDPFGVG